MSRCVKCGSFAINPHHHGRAPDKNLHLCDVCYWQEEAAALEAQLAEARAENERLREFAERLREFKEKMHSYYIDIQNKARRLAELEAEVKLLQQELAEAQAENARLREVVEEAKQSLEEMRDTATGWPDRIDATVMRDMAEQALADLRKKLEEK